MQPADQIAVAGYVEYVNLLYGISIALRHVVRPLSEGYDECPQKRRFVPFRVRMVEEWTDV